MLVTPVYSPRSGSSVDPADKIPLHLINSPMSPLTHDGSGDKVTAQEMETGDGVEGKKKDDMNDKGMKAEGDGKGNAVLFESTNNYFLSTKKENNNNPKAREKKKRRLKKMESVMD